MFKVIITGKPSDWHDYPEPNDNPIVSHFTLTEKAWLNGAVLERKWKVFVPRHKAAWAHKKAAKPEYRVMVEADDLAMSSDMVHGFCIRLVEIHDI